MYTKLLPIRSWHALKKLVCYLQNAGHKNHKEYRIEGFQTSHPCLTPQNLISELKGAFPKIPKNKHGGHPLRIFAWLLISRTPFYVWSTKPEDQMWQEEERAEYARGLLDLVVPDGLHLNCWHINKAFRCGDINALIPNLVDLDQPYVRNRSDTNFITSARRAADSMTDLLNAKRRARGRTLIQTMPERQRELTVKNRGATLAEQLARRPDSVRLKNLKQAIEELGHEVTRFNQEGDTISVNFQNPDWAEATTQQHRGKKHERKKKAPKKRKAKRISITSLLREVFQIRKTMGHENKIAALTVPKPVDESQVEASNKNDYRNKLRDNKIESLMEKWEQAGDELACEDPPTLPLLARPRPSIPPGKPTQPPPSRRRTP
jgi:hypothetical protein